MILLYYGVIIPLSYLPLAVLYRFSDLLYYAVYYVAPYRKKVVLENLKNSFPEKSAEEIRAISKKFFAHLCDLVFESIKGCSISEEEIRKRHRYANIECLESYYDQNKSVSIIGGHYGNWEWVALSLPLATRFQTFGIYQKLSHPFMNSVLKKSRERNGMRLVSTKKVASALKTVRHEPITMGYIGDQCPTGAGRRYWLKFLNQDTPTLSGFEFLAKKHDNPVVFLNIAKTKRGYYEGTFLPVSDHPQSTREGEIVEAYMKLLEGFIREKPEYWLWSHRRWKIKRS